MFRRTVLPFVVWLFYRLWSMTWRLEVIESPQMTQLLAQRKPVILAHWHGDELAVISLVPRYRVATMTSTSRDGELMDGVLKRLGAVTSRGSSTRGGAVALRGLIRLVKQGYPASMAVDGPKGPLHVVKPGVFELSRLARAHIVPLGAACSSAIVFNKSWNKARFPKPFAKVVVRFLDPWPIVEAGDDIQLLSQKLARDISDAAHQAAKDFAQA